VLAELLHASGLAVVNGHGSSYQGESRVLDSPKRVCAGQAWFEYPATSVPFSNPGGGGRDDHR
jgi:hypothetical protein